MWWTYSTSTSTNADIIYWNTSSNCSNTVIVQWPSGGGNSEKPEPKLTLSLEGGIVLPKET